MPDLSKPPICPGECIRCGRIARYWFCTSCTAEPRYVNRIPKPKTVVKCICGGNHPVGGPGALELRATA